MSRILSRSGRCSNGPYLRLNCHILLSEGFGMAFVFQSVFELSKRREKNTGNWFHMFALNRRSKFFGSSTSHVTLPQTITRNGKPWNVVIKKNLLLKNYTPECFFWHCHKGVSTLNWYSYTFLSQSSHITSTVCLIFHWQFSCSTFHPIHTPQIPNNP